MYGLNYIKFTVVSVVLCLCTQATTPMQQFRAVVSLGFSPSCYGRRLKSLLNSGLFSCRSKNTEFILCQREMRRLISSSAQHITMQPLVTFAYT